MKTACDSGCRQVSEVVLVLFDTSLSMHHALHKWLNDESQPVLAVLFSSPTTNLKLPKCLLTVTNIIL